MTKPITLQMFSNMTDNFPKPKIVRTKIIPAQLSAMAITPTVSNSNQNTNAIIIVATVLLIGGIVYLYWRNKQIENKKFESKS